jgi:hypothetical protein
MSESVYCPYFFEKQRECENFQEIDYTKYSDKTQENGFNEREYAKQRAEFNGKVCEYRHLKDDLCSCPLRVD